MSDGDSNSGFRDSATKAASRASAVSAALAESETSESPAYEASEPATAETGADNATPYQDAGADQSVESNGASQAQPDQALSQESQLAAPKNWAKDRQDSFNALPDEAKRIVLEREREYSEGIRKNGETNSDHRKRSEAIAEILKPYEADLQKSGMDHAGAVRWMIEERTAFNRDPAGFLLGYVKQNNADPAKFIQHLAERAGLTQDQLQGQQPQQQTQAGEDDNWWQDDPVYKAVNSQNETLKGQIAQLEQQLSQFHSQYTERQSQSLVDEIRTFQSAADSSGNPLYPHYEVLTPIMQRLMDMDPEISAIPDYRAQEKLKAAYEKAVWLNNDTRTSVIDTQVNQKLSERMSQQSLEKAKSAATIRGSLGANGAAQKGKMSRSEAVAAALREHG
jgi:hypothetical protein